MPCSIPTTTTTTTGPANAAQPTPHSTLCVKHLQALIEKGLVDERQIQEMLAENQGKYKGSLLEELLNELIERLVEEGYLTLREQLQQAQERQQGNGGPGEVSEPLPRDVHFEITEKGLDFRLQNTAKPARQFWQSAAGRHDTTYLSTGRSGPASSKRYEFGDTINLDVNTTLLSAIQREGLQVPLNLEYGDLHVHQYDYQSSCATVVMLDCSHSMISYGEDRFTPAKKVALAMSHLIRTQYPGDSLKVVLFHDGAEELPLGKLATTHVGPYHTNTAEGLRLASTVAGATKER